MASNSIQIYNDTVLKQSVLQGYQYQRTNENLGRFTMGEIAFTRDTGRLFVGNYTNSEKTQDSKYVTGGILAGNKYLGFIDSKPLIHFSASGKTGWKPLSYEEDVTDTHTGDVEKALFCEGSRFRQNDGENGNGWNKKSEYIQKYGVYSGDYTFDIYNNALILFDKSITTNSSEQPNREVILDADTNIKKEHLYDKNNNEIALEDQRRRTPLYNDEQKHNGEYPIYGDGYVMMRILEPDGITIGYKDRTFKNNNVINDDGSPLTIDENWSHNYLEIKGVPATTLSASFSNQFYIKDSKIYLNPSLTGISEIEGVNGKLSLPRTLKINSKSLEFDFSKPSTYPNLITDKILTLKEVGDNAYNVTVKKLPNPSYTISLKNGLVNPITGSNFIVVSQDNSLAGQLAIGLSSTTSFGIDKIGYDNPFNVSHPSSYFYNGTGMYNSDGSLYKSQEYDNVYFDQATSKITKFDSFDNIGLNYVKNPLPICWNLPNTSRVKDTITSNLHYIIKPYIQCVKKEIPKYGSSLNEEDQDKFNEDICVLGNNDYDTSVTPSNIPIIDGFSYSPHITSMYEDKILKSTNETKTISNLPLDFIITGLDQTLDNVPIYKTKTIKVGDRTITCDVCSSYLYDDRMNVDTIYKKDNLFYKKINGSYIQINSGLSSTCANYIPISNSDYTLTGNTVDGYQECSYNNKFNLFSNINEIYKNPSSEIFYIQSGNSNDYVQLNVYENGNSIETNNIHYISISNDDYTKAVQMYQYRITSIDDAYINNVKPKRPYQINESCFENPSVEYEQMVKDNDGNTTIETKTTYDTSVKIPKEDYESYQVLLSLQKTVSGFIPYFGGDEIIDLPSAFSDDIIITKIQISTSHKDKQFVTLFDAEKANSYSSTKAVHYPQGEDGDAKPIIVLTPNDAGIPVYQVVTNSSLFLHKEYNPFFLKIHAINLQEYTESDKTQIKYLTMKGDLNYSTTHDLTSFGKIIESVDEIKKVYTSSPNKTQLTDITDSVKNSGDFYDFENKKFKIQDFTDEDYIYFVFKADVSSIFNITDRVKDANGRLCQFESVSNYTNDKNEQINAKITFIASGKTNYKDESDNYIQQFIIKSIEQTNTVSSDVTTYQWSTDNHKNYISSLVENGKIIIPSSMSIQIPEISVVLYSIKQTRANKTGYVYDSHIDTQNQLVIPEHANSLLLQVHRQTNDNSFVAMYLANDIQNLKGLYDVSTTEDTQGESSSNQNQGYFFPFELNKTLPTILDNSCINDTEKVIYNSNHSGCTVIEVPLYKSTIDGAKGFVIRLANTPCGNTEDKFLIRVIGYRV